MSSGISVTLFPGINTQKLQMVRRLLLPEKRTLYVDEMFLHRPGIILKVISRGDHDILRLFYFDLVHLDANN